jgi:hypothetical protein
MSVPAFKETVAIRIENAIAEQNAYLVERDEDLALMRKRQGTIAGLRLAQEIIKESYRESYG